ncbi:unnamed protein product [Heligmosomoides polygyrus]|uniref:NUC domain-containing protein n=1 Tax=Heligmosomoides polygyrus TaxID=6339 RepID=A0A3P7ZU06_HELPZ|nr:unnamed protein product [Heligmosomoides polygyrus]
MENTSSSTSPEVEDTTGKPEQGTSRIPRPANDPCSKTCLIPEWVACKVTPCCMLACFVLNNSRFFVTLKLYLFLPCVCRLISWYSFKSAASLTCSLMNPHPPLILISFDGYANYYLRRKLQPTFDKIAKCGVTAERVYPSFPSLTFPNHVTISNGRYPGNHGIGEWKIARPGLMMAYITQPDHTGHRRLGKPMNQTLKDVDEHLGNFLKELDDEGFLGCVNLVLVSDHGIFLLHIASVADYLNVKSQIYLKNSLEDVLEKFSCKTEDRVRVFTKTTIPVRFHYSNSSRIGDVVLLGKHGTQIAFESNPLSLHGAHGFDYIERPIHTIMYARGPDFKENYVLPAFQNVEYMNLFTKIKRDTEAHLVVDFLEPLNDYTRSVVQRFGQVLSITGTAFDEDYDGAASPTHIFRILITCKEKWSRNGPYCAKPENTRALSFILPHIERDPNCLKRDEFLLQYSARIKDVETISGLHFNFITIPYMEQVLLRLYTNTKLW